MILLTMTGFSGSGKSSTVRLLENMEIGAVEVLSHTTRPPREGVDDRRIFVSQSTFEAMYKAGEFCETVHYDNSVYGIERARISALLPHRIPVLDVAEDGVRQIREANLAPVVSVFITASPAQLLERLRQRGDPDSTIVRRLKRSIDEAHSVNSGFFHFVFQNDDMHITAQKIVRVLQGEAVESDPFHEEKFVSEIQQIIRNLEEEML